MDNTEYIVCPKKNSLVDTTNCAAIRNLPKIVAEYFSVKVCKTVAGCPNEDYCTIFECGWSAVGTFLSTLKD